MISLAIVEFLALDDCFLNLLLQQKQRSESVFKAIWHVEHFEFRL